MKKVLFISPQPFFQWRGSPIRVSFSLLALSKLDYKVDLLTLPIGEDTDLQGVNIIRVANPFKVKDIPIGPSLWKLFFDFLILFKGIHLCLKHRYDLVHGVEEAGFIGALLARLISARAIFEKHSDPFSYKSGFVKNLMLHGYAIVEKLTVRLVDAVICTGPGLVKQVNDMGLSTRAFNIYDIPSSLSEPSTQAVEDTRSELRHAEDDVLVTFVGSFAVYQGVDLMIEAIPHVVQKAPNARFVVIGGNPGEIEKRKKQLRGNGAESQVSFLGKVAPNMLSNYLAASDILLSPRISGVNTPLKILDYMKAGRSIAATDVASNRLLLNDSLAVLARPEPQAFAEAIISLVNNREKREEMGRKLRALHESTYNFREYCKDMADCYEYVSGK